MCKKQTPVSHSSTESETICLDAGVRMGGIATLDLWDLVIEVFHSSPEVLHSFSNQSKKAEENVQENLLHDTPSRKQTKNPVKTPSNLCNVDYVSSNVKSSQSGAMLCLHFWRWWSGDQDDHQGQKSNNETRILNPQSCAWLVIWQNQQPRELLLIGYSTESIWTPRSKSNSLTPKTNSQTYWQRAITHVMSGIIFCVCSTLAISVLPMFWSDVEKNAKSIRRRKSHSKIEGYDEFSLAMQRKGILMFLPLLQQKARGKPEMKVKYLWARGLSSIKEQEDCFGRSLIKLLRVECWQEFVFSRVESWWIDGSLNRDHLVCSQSTRTHLLLVTMKWTLTLSQNQTCRYYPDHLLHLFIVSIFSSARCPKRCWK